MTRKLINIKNILRIFISVMVIISMFKSCKAFAAGATTSMLEDINTKTNTIFEYYGKSYRNKFNSTYDIGYNTGINKMCIGITASDSPYRANWLFVFYPDNNPMGVTNRSPKTYNTWFYAGVNMDNGNYSAYSGGTIPITTKWAYIYTEFAWQSATGYSFTAGEEYGAYILTEPPNPFYFGNMFSQNYNYNNEVIQACELNYNYRVQFIENVVTESYEVANITATLDDITLESTDLGSYWTLKCANSTLLKYNKIYTLNVEINREDTTNELSEQILFVPPGTIISSGAIVSYPSGDYSFNTENATNQIIENQDQNNSSIIDSINGLIGNLPSLNSSSGDVSGDLSSGFDAGSGILGGIFSLFVPDGQFFKDYFEDLNNWFGCRLGLLYFPIELTINFLQRCINIDFTSQVLTIGPYIMPLEDDFELVPEIQIDFQSFLENETVNSIHEIYLFITDGLILFGLYRLIIKKYNNIVKNKEGG